MNNLEQYHQGPSSRTVVRLVCFLLLILTLNVCLGCKRVLNVKVENADISSVTVFSISTINGLNGVTLENRHSLGTISPGSAIELSNAIPDEGDELVLQIQDDAGKTIGEVRQSRDVVHAKMEGRTWRVKIPADMTPAHTEAKTTTPAL